jgi:uncharacterized protein (DUF2147 family)
MIPVMMALAMAVGSPAPASPVEGTWHNPKNSVAVKTGACGDRLCGWVVRASDEAQADARDGGTPKLIGTALLREYRPSGRGSTLTLVDANTIDVKGCLIGGFLCKTQTWHRG